MYDKITSPLFRYNSERLIMKRLKNINLFINEKENLKSYLDFQQKLNLSAIISFTLKKALSKSMGKRFCFCFSPLIFVWLTQNKKIFIKTGKFQIFFFFFYTHLKIVLGITNHFFNLLFYRFLSKKV